MAGDWIPWDIGLETKPEVLWIADRLGIGNHETAARLMVLWSWASLNTENGDVHGVTFCALDRITGADGIAQAMSECQPTHWLELFDWGVRFLNFDTHNSSSAKRRLLSARRMKMLRSMRNKSDALCVTPSSVISTLSNSLAVKGGAGGSEDGQLRKAIVAEWSLPSKTKDHVDRLDRLVFEFEAVGATPREIPIRRAKLLNAWGAGRDGPESLARHWGTFPLTEEDRPWSERNPDNAVG